LTIVDGSAVKLPITAALGASFTTTGVGGGGGGGAGGFFLQPADISNSDAAIIIRAIWVRVILCF
jgi:hypothetical protein